MTGPVRTSLLALPALALLLAVELRADPAAKPVVWYKIDARLKLDDQQHPSILEAQEQLTWLNDSPDTISELQFHLSLNAFKNEKSTFFRESGGQLRGDKFEPGEWGWIEVTSMKLAGGEDLTKKITFIASAIRPSIPTGTGLPRAAQFGVRVSF
jgi:hypothetical protein